MLYHYSLFCILLISSKFKHLFICLLAIWIFISVNAIPFAHFLFLIFLSFSYRFVGILCMSWILDPLSIKLSIITFTSLFLYCFYKLLMLFHELIPCYTECDPWTSSISIIWELVLKMQIHRAPSRSLN